MTEKLSVRQPEAGADPVYVQCGRCEKNTPHNVIVSAHYEISDDIEVWEQYQVIRCGLCHDLSFRKLSQCSEDVDYDEQDVPFLPETQELYPRRAAGRPLLKPSDGIPPTVLRIYNETCSAVANDQPILAAAGIRAIVEAACRERRARGDNLEARIDDLVAKDWLSRHEAKVLHGPRLLGNRALHQVKAPSTEVLNAALEVVEHILKTVYTLKRRSARLPRKRTRTQGSKSRSSLNAQIPNPKP